MKNPMKSLTSPAMRFIIFPCDESKHSPSKGNLIDNAEEVMMPLLV